MPLRCAQKDRRGCRPGPGRISLGSARCGGHHARFSRSAILRSESPRAPGAGRPLGTRGRAPRQGLAPAGGLVPRAHAREIRADPHPRGTATRGGACQHGAKTAPTASSWIPRACSAALASGWESRYRRADGIGRGSTGKARSFCPHRPRFRSQERGAKPPIGQLSPRRHRPSPRHERAFVTRVVTGRCRVHSGAAVAVDCHVAVSLALPVVKAREGDITVRLHDPGGVVVGDGLGCQSRRIEAVARTQSAQSRGLRRRSRMRRAPSQRSP